MPLIEIDALPQPADIDTAHVVVELNRAIAASLGCRLDAVWTVWHEITGPYAQGEEIRVQQPHDSHGPIAHVYLHRSPEETARVVETIEQVLVRELSLSPDNVFVTVQPVHVIDRAG